MPVPGLYDVTIFLDHIDQGRADAVEAAIRATWKPIHTGWAAPRFTEGLVQMTAIGYITGSAGEKSPDEVVKRLRDAIVKANGRAARVDFHVEEVLTIPGVEYIIGPRGAVRKHSLARPPRGR